MAIDTSIYNALKPVQIDSPLDAYSKVAQFQQMQNQNRLADLMFGEKQREVSDSNTLNQLYKSAVGADGQIDRQKLYSGVAQGGLGAKLPGIQKGFADQDKSMIEAQKAKIETGLKQFEMIGQIMSGVKDQASYDAARQQAAQILGPEHAAKMPAVYDPTEIERNKIRAMSVKDQLEHQLKTMKFKLDNANEAFSLDENGDPVANTAYQGYQMRKAKAGKTDVNLAVNTEKTYAGNVAEGLAKQDVSAIDIARSAPQRVETARSVKSMLDKNPITGSGAEAKLALTKALSTSGLIDGQQVTNTETLAGLLASQTLDAIKSSGLGAGQGFTDKDRQFLERAKSGNIEINSGTLRYIADLNERAGMKAIEQGNTVIRRLKKSPGMGNVGSSLDEIQTPGSPSSKGGGRLVQNPDGSFTYVVN